MGSRLRTVSVLAALLLVACGSSPTGPNENGGNGGSPGDGPLPLGGVAASQSSCPGGSQAGASCRRMTVACPSIASLGATLRVTRPASTNRGTVLLTTGGAGTFLNGSVELGPQMVQTFLSDGLTVAELAWDEPGIWGGPQARTLACRYATAARWTYDNVHSGGPFIAQGTSGGAAQVAFGLAHYGLATIIRLANLGSGPPGCPLCTAGGQGPEALLPGPPPSVNRSPQLSYPGTVVRIFLGSDEPTAEIIADARAYHDAITSPKSLTVVPGAGHHLEQTQAGVNAYVSAVRSILEL